LSAYGINFGFFGSFLSSKPTIFAVFGKSYQQLGFLRSCPCAAGVSALFWLSAPPPLFIGFSAEGEGKKNQKKIPKTKKNKQKKHQKTPDKNTKKTDTTSPKTDKKSLNLQVKQLKTK